MAVGSYFVCLSHLQYIDKPETVSQYVDSLRSAGISVPSPTVHSVGYNHPAHRRFAMVQLPVHADICLWAENVTTFTYKPPHGFTVTSNYLKLGLNHPLLSLVTVLPVPDEGIVLVALRLVQGLQVLPALT